MSSGRHAGVQGAIAILTALRACGGASRCTTLMAETGVARASFYRIVRVLNKAGLLDCARGIVRVGPAWERLMQVHGETFGALDPLMPDTIAPTAAAFS